MPDEKVKYTFENFLGDVSPDHLPFVMDVHQALSALGYKTKVELAKSGFVVSYLHPKNKKTVFNYLFRKSGMLIRIYGDHVGEYMAFLQTLPPSMIAAIDKEQPCRRLLDPAACNSRCPMGYVFSIHETHFQKCRYRAFLFSVDGESIPFLREWIDRESSARGA